MQYLLNKYWFDEQNEDWNQILIKSEFDSVSEKEWIFEWKLGKGMRKNMILNEGKEENIEWNWFGWLKYEIWGF